MKNGKNLSMYERIVCAFAIEGYRDSAIATELAISAAGVKDGIQNAMRKVGASNRTQLFTKLEESGELEKLQMFRDVVPVRV